MKIPSIAVMVLYAKTYCVSFGDIEGIETAGNTFSAADGELVGLSDVTLVDRQPR